MAWSGTDFPCAFLPAWVLVRPVGTGDEAIRTVDLLLTLSCASKDNIDKCRDLAQEWTNKKAAYGPTILLKDFLQY